MNVINDEIRNDHFTLDIGPRAKCLAHRIIVVPDATDTMYTNVSDDHLLEYTYTTYWCTLYMLRT